MTDEMTATITELVKSHEQMKNWRANFDAHWRETARYVYPERQEFGGWTRAPGNKVQEFVFDSTAIDALPKYASAMESLLCPPADRWHNLRLADESLNDSPEVRIWLERVRDWMFALRLRPQARFQANLFQTLKEVGAFGNGILFVDDDPGLGFRYYSCELSRVWFLTDFTGKIDTVHREWRTTPRQLAQRFGKPLPPRLAAKAERDANAEVIALHCVHPANDIDAPFASAYRYPFASWYVCLDTKEQLGADGGYRYMPYCIARDDVTPGETYGRGPAMRALPDIKTLNQLVKEILRAQQKSVNPPMLAYGNGSLQSFQTRPGAINWGGLTANGNRLLDALQFGGNLPVAYKELERLQRVIGGYFLLTLFEILVQDRTEMTATEVLMRLQEKGQLLGPSAARLQSDLLGSVIDAELTILMQAGLFRPGAPLAAPLEAQGVDIRPQYVSQLNTMMRAPEAVALDTWVQHAIGIAQVDPTALDRIDVDTSMKIYAEALRVPARAVRSDAALAALKQQRASAAQAQQLVAAAPLLGKAAKDLTAASQAAVTAPSTGAFGLPQ